MAAHGPAVLGLGGGVDVEIRLTAGPLAELVARYGIGAGDLDAPSALVTERDLVCSILRYVRTGGGGEHFVATAEVLLTFAQRFPHAITLGGTSVRAGIVMAALGVPSLLHLVTVNDHVRRLLPPAVAYLSSDENDTMHPHLVVQYPAGLHLCAGELEVTAPLANRLIYVNDPANEAMVLRPDLGELLANASIFLISGFNAMREQDLLSDRLAQTARAMTRLPADALVYFEDAGYHQPGFSDRVRTALLPRIDVYGLNEDELQGYVGRPVDLLDPCDVAQALGELRRLITGPTLVLHTKHWALAYGDRAGSFGPALDTAVSVASTRYARGDALTAGDVERLRARPRSPAAVTFAAGLTAILRDQVHVQPGFVLDVAEPTTVGLGDSFVGGFLAAVASR